MGRPLPHRPRARSATAVRQARQAGHLKGRGHLIAILIQMFCLVERLLVSTSGMLLRGRVPASKHHALAPRKGVFVADRQIRRVAELDQPRGPRFVACVDS